MKKILIGIVLVAGLISCSGLNSSKCRETVEKVYPDAIIYSSPGRSYTFIVMRDNCEVLLVTTGDLYTTKITNTNLIKRAK